MPTILGYGHGDVVLGMKANGLKEETRGAQRLVAKDYMAVEQQTTKVNIG